jgi:hypothetical protein
MEKLTNKEKVMAYIKMYGGITTMEAFKYLGVTRLAAVVFDLRAEGTDIKGETVKIKSGKRVTWYHL